uniref:Small ribosomal subunit protein mS35 mitochondrial conserved domain-containing protein n=1 Tax=Prymnesium polylepis TaxID=72548 RepID=A0A7S4I6F5_9EUKA
MPPPPAPTTHSESWVPASHVSPDADENALQFRTRFYLDSTMGSADGLQPEYQSKVQMTVQLEKLGLSEAELDRVIAVCPARHYDRRKGELKLQTNKFPSPQQNKSELRRMLDALVEDARENAESHAQAPDSEKPLHARSPGWRWEAHTSPVGS